MYSIAQSHFILTCYTCREKNLQRKLLCFTSNFMHIFQLCLSLELLFTYSDGERNIIITMLIFNTMLVVWYVTSALVSSKMHANTSLEKMREKKVVKERLNKNLESNFQVNNSERAILIGLITHSDFCPNSLSC